MKTHIVGLAGLANTGKDTVANILHEVAGFECLAFADALRAEVCEAFAIEPLYLQRRETKETPMAALALRNCRTLGFVGASVLAMEQSGQLMAGFLDQARSPRQVMQLWGTEYRRRQDPAYWTRRLVDRIQVRRKGGAQRFVVTDVRFPNEAATVSLMGGTLWQVTRPGAGHINGHASDVDGSQFNPARVLANDGDLQQLRRTVLAAYWHLDTGLDAAELAQGCHQ